VGDQHRLNATGHEDATRVANRIPDKAAHKTRLQYFDISKYILIPRDVVIRDAPAFNGNRRMARLGWIGLGRMGQPMAMRLLEAGHALAVFDREPARLCPAIARGARGCASAAEAAADADAIFLSLPSGAAVEEVALSPTGIVAAAPETVVVDTSSIHPQLTGSLAGRLHAACGSAWVDAPVSGGPGRAAAGTLSCFLGGETATVARVAPLIAHFAANVTHIGPIGSGQIAKTCNQAVVCATIAGWVEALDYAASAGLDRATIVAALAGGGAESAVRTAFAPALAAGRLPGSPMMLKDLDIIRDMARETGSSMPLNALVAAIFEQRMTRKP
jgi:3-hydroxyisobutyrate dehydrogenase-like beta-hydroxyacid dehydrogenase